MKLQAAQQTVIGLHVLGFLRLGGILGLPLHAPDYGRDDGGGQLILDIEDFFEVTVEFFRPDVITAACVDQLGVDPQTLTDSPHGPLETVSNAQFAPDFTQIQVAVLESEAGVARDYEKIVKARQFGDQVL